MRHSRTRKQSPGLILGCPQLRAAFPKLAEQAFHEAQKVYPSILTKQAEQEVLQNDPYGPFAKLEAVVYAKAINQAIGSTVVLRMLLRGPKTRPMYNVDPNSLFVENLVAENMRGVGDQFLQQTGFMRFNSFYNEFVYLSLLYNDDVIVSNHEN